MTQHFITAFLILTLPLAAQKKRPTPEIGYLYPAGGKAGTTVRVLAGGQALRNAKRAWCSGKGVKVEIIKNYRMPRNLNGEQRREILFRIACRKAELEGAKPPQPSKQLLADRKARQQKGGKKKPKFAALPPIPFLDTLDHADLRQIEHFMTTVITNQKRRQINPQLSELVLLNVTIAPDTPPGRREIRLAGPLGPTNPRAFLVGRIKEVREFEPNDPKGLKRKSPPPAVPSPPFTLNGQILPGDVDRFRFKAAKGQSLVVQGHARSLIPYLADAVPGWFQMVLALYGPGGRQVAFDDDFRFHPDPVLHFTIPKGGVYELEVRDSIYRGRQDFVYRIDVAESPFVTAAFPLGARQGSKAAAAVKGWNLPKKKISLDTRPGPPIRHTRIDRGPLPGNLVPYAVGTLPEIFEREPNNSHSKAQALTLPAIVNGRIGKPGDKDVFRIDAKAGQQFVAEVTARRLNSPLDSLIRLTDATGETLAWNDDRMEKDGHLHLGPGLLTHHADSYLIATLPADGPWFVTIGDAENHGGDAFSYRLRLSAPRPDFELRVTPSAILAPPNGHIPLEVFALRNDGFDGPIVFSLENAPEGASIEGGTIPPGAHRIKLTLHLPPSLPPGPVPLRLVGHAKAGDRTITRTAIPADDTMQAFLWRHLLPADTWLVLAGTKNMRRPTIRLLDSEPIRIPPGGSAEIRVALPEWIAKRDFEFVLSRAPEGLTLSPPRIIDGPRKPERTLVFRISAAAKNPAPGTAGNLIIQAFGTRKSKNGKPANRWPVGYLPAIPFNIK